VPRTAIRISHFGWMTRPVRIPATGIRTSVAMPPMPKVRPALVAL